MVIGVESFPGVVTCVVESFIGSRSFSQINTWRVFWRRAGRSGVVSCAESLIRSRSFSEINTCRVLKKISGIKNNGRWCSEHYPVQILLRDKHLKSFEGDQGKEQGLLVFRALSGPDPSQNTRSFEGDREKEQWVPVFRSLWGQYPSDERHTREAFGGEDLSKKNETLNSTLVMSTSYSESDNN